MSATDALTITSVPYALTRYYDAKEREESAVLYINDAYLEVLNSLEKLEAENAKMRKFCLDLYAFAFNCYHGVFDQEVFFRLREKYHELQESRWTDGPVQGDD